MAIQLVNLGLAPNDGMGDPLRSAFGKTNDNVVDLANRVGGAEDLGSITTTITLDAQGARGGIWMGTLTGASAAIGFTNVPASVPSVYTLVLKQDATGGRTVTYPGSAMFLYGGDGSLNPASGAVSVITFVTTNGTSWLVTVADARGPALESLYFNPPGNGNYYWPFDTAMTVDLGAVTKLGTGTLAYAKSAGGGAFANVSGSTTFAEGDALRVTVTGFASWLAFAIPRTA